MIQLKPIRETTGEYDQIEKRIKDLFRKVIYLPLLREFSQKSKLKNSIDDLYEALRTGRLTFNRGKFSGRLNSTISKALRDIGAKWNRTDKCYSLPMKKMSMQLRSAIMSSEDQFQNKLDRIDKKLSEVVPDELVSTFNVSRLFDRTLWKVEKEFQQSIKNITVSPKLTPEQAARLSEEWNNNLKLYIKNFSVEETQRLREQIQKSVMAGNRYESAIKTIQQSFEVTANKAKFLARQETALMMTTFKQVRYQSAGVNHYKWKSVTGTTAHPVRPRHQYLNDQSQMKGKVFRFDDPPITSEEGETVRRNNPGQDYNCRCVSIPVLKFKPADFAK